MTSTREYIDRWDREARAAIDLDNLVKTEDQRRILTLIRILRSTEATVARLDRQTRAELKNALALTASVQARVDRLIERFEQQLIPIPRDDRAGAWVARYSDWTGVAVFATEADALRYAVDKAMAIVEFHTWGEIR